MWVGVQDNRYATQRIIPSYYASIGVASKLTGYTVAEINEKIRCGEWRQGREWDRAGECILIYLQGYRKWVEGAIQDD